MLPSNKDFNEGILQPTGDAFIHSWALFVYSVLLQTKILFMQLCEKERCALLDIFKLDYSLQAITVFFKECERNVMFENNHERSFGNIRT